MKRRPFVFCLALALLCSQPNFPAHGRATRAQVTATNAAPSVVQFEGLRGRVTIRRDERGVPYVEASNDEDLYFAQGYVVASDRLVQMDFMRRTARGELSEIFGSATLEEDRRRRTYGLARTAEANVAHLPADVRAALEAYARGVNAFIAAMNEQTTPPEFRLLQYRPRPWTVADSMVVGKLFSELLSTTWPTDLARAAFASLPPDKQKELFPSTSPLDVLVVGTDAEKPKARTSTAAPRASMKDALGVLRAVASVEAQLRASRARLGFGQLDNDERAASNNWVVSGRRTATGKPLLANDPHLPAGAPSIWYMIHLSAPGLRVAGVTAPGAPGVLLGHNASIAWGATNLGPDVQDLYLEKFDPANPRRYQTPAGWRDADVRREEIKVRKSPLGTETETVVHEVTLTRHGPVVFEQGGARYALRWAALDPRAVEFAGFFRLNRARNWGEFRKALSDYSGPTQNFVYADTDGHIGYYGAGRVPTRHAPDGATPFDGSTDAGEWTGFIPFDELPHVFDPPSGLIVTANSRVVGTSYPHHLTHDWFAPVRARRIYDLLNTKPKLTTEDFLAVLGDTYSITGKTFARGVVEASRDTGAGGDAKWQETLKLLEAWDGRVEPESRAALLVSEMRKVFQQKVLEAAVGPELARTYRWDNRITLLDRLITERPRAWLPAGFKDYAEFLRAVHTEARAA
ncbi:MAG TPA: penicillin acylase family protein, partial [Pyrinomonadaceae bacterium]|nr:penicillin acylase family protein [Pyrinomonadaceae bacterium]